MLGIKEEMNIFLICFLQIQVQNNQNKSGFSAWLRAILCHCLIRIKWYQVVWASFSSTVTKGDNYCYFLFASLGNGNLPNRVLLIKKKKKLQ